MAIPKIIHVCWFGKAERNRNIVHCENSRKLLSDRGYKIHVWNENNYDFNKSPAIKKAYSEARWSLVSNYARLDLLKEYGGIYVDTDIEVIKDFGDLLEADFFIGFMWDCALGTAVIGSSPNNKIVCDILDLYDSKPSSLISPNNNTFTDYFISNVDGFSLTGEHQFLNKTIVLNKFAFEHPTLFRRKNYTVHHFSQSWVHSSSLKKKLKRAVIACCSLWLYRKYVCYHSKKISKYRDLYLKQRRLNYVNKTRWLRIYKVKMLHID